MRVGVPTEIKADEYRVALTPAGVRELVDHGHEVLVQRGAGEGSAIADSDYEAQGARDPARRRRGVRRGRHDRQGQGAAARGGRAGSSRATRCSPTCTWRPTPSSRAGSWSPARPASPTRPSRTPRGRLPLLAPMSEVAGKIATQAGAFMLEKPLGGRGILLGGVPGVASAKVMVIGGGVVGMNAAFIAIGMEAEVYVYDRNIDRLRELDLVLRRARLHVLRVDAGDRAAAARDRPRDRRACSSTAPRRRTWSRARQLKLMKPGAVLVDVSIDQGGCFETSRADDALGPDLRGRRRSRTTAWRTCPARCRSPRPTR